jgi:hypothetical protein
MLGVLKGHPPRPHLGSEVVFDTILHLEVDPIRGRSSTLGPDVSETICSAKFKRNQVVQFADLILPLLEARSSHRIAPRPFLTIRDLRIRRPAELPPLTLLQETKKFGPVPAEYLRQFFTELEKVKPRANYCVSHAISSRDGDLCVLVSLGEFRDRVYVDSLDEDPLTAAQKAFRAWQARLRTDEDIE